MPLSVCIAGASGYIGTHLLRQITGQYSVRALSRGSRDDDINVQWVKADLFSFQSTQKALENTDIAIYLVHSMLPSSRLFQGNFQDTDLFLADNFANACRENNVKQIIYLGGPVLQKNMSRHLRSRKEVEDIFLCSKIPVTILRAGMVVGDGGSSFEILKNLVFNLPAMILPKWAYSQTQVIYVDDLINILTKAIGNEHFYNKAYNVANGEGITYDGLIRKTAAYLGQKKLLVSVPINSTAFSKLWVSIFGKSDYELVSPLIDSLKIDLPAPDIDNDLKSEICYRTFDEMLQQISKKKMKRQTKRKKQQHTNTVRSIQRLNNPAQLSVKEVGLEYIEWLPRYFKSLIKVKTQKQCIYFNLLLIKKPLLVLQQIDDVANLDRIKFHIIGGLLSKTKDTGWLEFRMVANGRFTLASINEFIPSLPWYLYIYTQAIIHAKVMKAFSAHLKSIKTTG